MKIRPKEGAIVTYQVEEAQEGEMWFNYLGEENIVTPEEATSIVRKAEKLYILQLGDIEYFSEEETAVEKVYYVDKNGELKQAEFRVPVLWLQDPEKFRAEVLYREEKKGEKIQEEQALAEIGKKWEIGKAYYNVEQFNKTSLGWALVRYDIDKFVKDGKVYRLVVLHDYRTTRGNHTTSFIILEEPLPRQITLQVPQEYMGLIIGKGGNNIKSVQQKYGIKIILQTQG